MYSVISCLTICHYLKITRLFWDLLALMFSSYRLRCASACLPEERFVTAYLNGEARLLMLVVDATTSESQNEANMDGKNMILLAFRVIFSFQPVIRLAPGCLPSNQSSSLGRSPGNGFAWWHSLVTSATWPPKRPKCEGCLWMLKWKYMEPLWQKQT